MCLLERGLHATLHGGGGSFLGRLFIVSLGLQRHIYVGLCILYLSSCGCSPDIGTMGFVRVGKGALGSSVMQTF